MKADLSLVPARRVPVSGRAGFSLVEICLAVGIVAFALLPLVGLLSVGLDSYHKSNMRGRAAQAVNQIATCIRTATTPTTGKTYAAPPFGSAGIAPISWNPGDSNLTFTVYFTDSGEVTTSSTTASMVAMVVLTAPTSQFAAGKAQIVVAWPAFGAPQYDPTKGITYVNSQSNAPMFPQGHEESAISFISN